MTLAALQSSNAHWFSSSQATGLTKIYQPDINIAIWERGPDQDVINALTELNQHQPGFTIKSMIHMDNARQRLNECLPECAGKAILADSIYLTLDLFSCLFEQSQVGIRFGRLSDAMCPRFHVDNLPVRLVQTLSGPGTEWLPEHTLDRRKLGRGNQGKPDHESGIYVSEKDIGHLQTGDIALLKGSGWEGNEAAALVHRSPPVPSGEARWFLSLDLTHG
ncbi:MAG: DUF1826 domain-containing protein [Saccharospirillum sp.]